MKSMTSINLRAKIKSACTFLRRLVCVPKCASCKTRLNISPNRNELNYGIPCFCNECLAVWHRAKSEMCHTCYKSADKCTCMPKKNTFMQPTIPSLFFYHPTQPSVQSKAIFTFKCKCYTELYDFMAEELAPKLQTLLDELEISASDCLFTYIPRTKRGIRKNGFDQSKVFAKKLCKKMGGECTLPLLLRVGGKEQKKLSTAQRRRNAEHTIRANTPLHGMRGQYGNMTLPKLLADRTVILIDDIITTGASADSAIKALKSNGAKTVIAASIARSEIKSKK